MKTFNNFGNDFDEAGRRIEKPLKISMGIIIGVSIVVFVLFLIMLANPQAIGQFLAKIVNGFASTLK
jgi:hypothetical protein